MSTTRRRRGEEGRSNGNSRQFYATVRPWEPTSADDAELMRRFTQEPVEPPLQITINGTAIELPRYNGVAWWFPSSREHPAESFFGWFFTIVNTTQTMSLFIWPVLLVFNFGWVYTLAAMVALLVPLGSRLEDCYGPNYGTAYTSLYVLQMALFLTSALVVRIPDFDPNPLVFCGGFVAFVFALGHVLCRLEKDVFGRTWNAAILAYGQLIVWIYWIILWLG